MPLDGDLSVSAFAEGEDAPKMAEKMSELSVAEPAAVAWTWADDVGSVSIATAPPCPADVLATLGTATAAEEAAAAAVVEAVEAVDVTFLAAGLEAGLAAGLAAGFGAEESLDTAAGNADSGAEMAAVLGAAEADAFFFPDLPLVDAGLGLLTMDGADAS